MTMNNSSYGSSDEAKNDARQPLWQKQRDERGFDDTELWNLFHHLAEHIAPRIKAFKDMNKMGNPMGCSSEEWDETLNKIVHAFEKIAEDCMWDLDKEENQKVNEGLDLFRQWYLGLWD